MRVIQEGGRGEWLRERVVGARRPDGLVPGGYAAAVRVLHEPSLVRDLGGAQSLLRITWRQAAALLGTRVEEGVPWAVLTGSDEDRTPLGPDLDLCRPEEGHLPPAVLAEVVGALVAGTSSTAGATAAVWVGWAELQPGPFGIGAVGGSADEIAAAIGAAQAEIAAQPPTAVQEATREGRTLDLPDREYVLLDCDLTELLDPVWVRTAGLGWTPEDDLPETRGSATPNLLWPADRSWVLVSEIDDPYTTVVGPEALVESIARLPSLETMRVPAVRRR